MAGLLAWAADVVKAHKDDEDEDSVNLSIPLVFTEEQQKYVHELNQKASALSRSIKDLRFRLPPPDISQRLPDLHAHSLASNAALTQQLNSHSSTREQTQMRVVTLQEENSAFEKAISNCEIKIQEKIQEADSLRRKLKEMEEMEKNLTAELEKTQTSVSASQSGKVTESTTESLLANEAGRDTDVSVSDITKKLEVKKTELISMEERVQELEKIWAQVQNDALKKPSPAQREKLLDKQLHSLIEQLAAKQTQAEVLVNEIHSKEQELDILNGLRRRIESSNVEDENARTRLRRVTSDRGSASTDCLVDGSHKLPYHTGGRNENLQKLMLLRSSFVLYILALHIAVFIKISF